MQSNYPKGVIKKGLRRKMVYKKEGEKNAPKELRRINSRSEHTDPYH